MQNYAWLVLFVIWIDEANGPIELTYSHLQKIIWSVSLCLLILQPYPIYFKHKIFVVFIFVVVSICTQVFICSGHLTSTSFVCLISSLILLHFLQIFISEPFRIQMQWFVSEKVWIKEKNKKPQSKILNMLANESMVAIYRENHYLNLAFK